MSRLSAPPSRGRDRDADDAWVAAQRDVIREVFDDVLDDVPHSEAGDRMLLQEMPSLILEFQNSWTIDNRLAFVGYGDDDIYPVLRAVSMTAVVNDRLLWSDNEDGGITGTRAAFVSTLGLDDAIETFIRGHDSRFSARVHRQLDVVLDDLLTEDEPVEGDETPDRRYNYHEALSDSINELAWEQFVSPLMDVVECLPRCELAPLAEALVRIEALRRLTGSETPTVGGPFDVALITRDAGVQWVRRKDVPQVA